MIGPHVESPITSYFRMPVIPTVLGFDPRLQFLHERDLFGALAHAVSSDIAGTFNVAGDGILTLSQAVRRLGRPAAPMPGPAVGALGSALRRVGRADFSPEQIDFLTYGRGVDTSRMRTELGFEPEFTTAGAFGDFAADLGLRMRPVDAALAGASALIGSGAPRG